MRFFPELLLGRSNDAALIQSHWKSQILSEKNNWFDARHKSLRGKMEKYSYIFIGVYFSVLFFCHWSLFIFFPLSCMLYVFPQRGLCTLYISPCAHLHFMKSVTNQINGARIKNSKALFGIHHTAHFHTQTHRSCGKVPVKPEVQQYTTNAIATSALASFA